MASFGHASWCPLDLNPEKTTYIDGELLSHFLLFHCSIWYFCPLPYWVHPYTKVINCHKHAKALCVDVLEDPKYRMELYSGYLEDHFNIHKLRAPGGRYMPAASTAQFAAAAPMGIYERRHHQPLAAAGVWGEHFRAPDYGSSAMAEMEAMEAKFEPADLQAEDDAGAVQEAALRRQHSPDSSDGQEPAARPREKIQRRLAQNREAARKSRLRKKAYIQNLETSRMKLARMEQELNRARQQGAYAGGSSSSSPVGLPASFDPGVAAFEMEYAHWVEEQERQTTELRAALQLAQAQGQGHDAAAAAAEVQLRVLVEAGVAHYDRLFRAKSAAAKSDVFFVMSGVWRPAADQFFLWIAGFRPSELLKVLAPQLGPLAEEQAAAVGRLRQTARQAEDALSQGMEKLQQSLAESLLLSTTAATEDDGGGGCYVGRQMASAMGRLEELAVFVDQADHLRQQTLGNMRRILTAAQAARGLVALGDYCQRLRVLSSLWVASPREPA